jgi:transposase
VVAHLCDQLRARLRRQRGYPPNPVTIVVDSQSIRAAETVGKATRGYDGAKKISGRKRHLAVDLGGLPMMVMVTPAGCQDRDVARDLLARLRLAHPELTCAWAADFLRLTLAIVSRPVGTTGFVLLPRRWVVERSLSWIMQARRNVRDYERLPQHSEAHITWAAITLMSRRLARLGDLPGTAARCT